MSCAGQWISICGGKLGYTQRLWVSFDLSVASVLQVMAGHCLSIDPKGQYKAVACHITDLLDVYIGLYLWWVKNLVGH